MQHKHTDCEIVAQPLSAIVKGGLRSIAASFPVFASLGQAWNEYETHRTSSRIQELLDNLKAELGRLGQTIDAHTDALRQCEDFPELLEITFEKVRKEFGEPKRATYARVLGRLIVDGNQCGHDEKVALIDSLDALSELDLHLLRLFKGKEETAIGDLGWRSLALSGDVNAQVWELACSLPRLEARGLILKTSTHTGVVCVRSPLNQDTARWLETKYRLLPLGKSLSATLF